MKKVIRLTESDLVKIVNKVIEEQKITDKGPVIPKNTKFKIDDNVVRDFKKFNVNFNKEETPETFLQKLNKSNVGVNVFHLNMEGWTFPIAPFYVQFKPNNKLKLRFSTEPLGGDKGVTMVRLTKAF
jgi:hypothetical protein